jgi:hypothetical protein
MCFKSFHRPDKDGDVHFYKYVKKQIILRNAAVIP